MNKNKQIILLNFMIILGLGLCIGIVLKYQNDRINFTTFMHKVTLLPEQIRYYDEVLTMSARMAAYTHKIHWIQRYNDAIEPLDNAIATVKDLFPRYVPELTKIDTANQILIGLEIQSLELVKKKQFEKAQHILFSHEYIKYKQTYSDGLQGVLNKIKIDIQKKNRAAENRVTILMSIITTILIVITLLGSFLVRIFRKQNQKLEKLTKHLEDQVIERTELLTKTNSLFEEAQKLTHLGNWEWNILDNILIWSDEIYRIFGLKPQEFAATYEAFINKVHKNDRVFVENSVNKALKTGEEYSIHHRIVLPDGSQKIVFEIGKVEFDNNQKPFRMIGTVQDITDTINREKELELQVKLASTDQLTGIYNRHKFEAIFKYEVERAKRYKNHLSLIMFDIDHFKKINDSYGHDIGDKVLQQVVNVVKEHIRKTDIFARWGGEEFFILCPETDIQKSILLAEKHRANIETASFGLVGKVTCSFGIASYNENESIKTLIKHVDDALYQAKEEGRNRVKDYTLNGKVANMEN